MKSCKIGLMNNYQWKRLKLVITASVMIFAGVCYRCSPNDGKQEEILLLGETEKGNAVSGDAADDRITAENLTADEVKADTKPEAVLETEAVCFVHICGAVECPGVYPLPQGSRIYQAVEMAGGFSADADQDGINLAQMVADGMKITVFTEAEAGTAAEGSNILYPEANPSGSVRAEEGTDVWNQKPKVNINTAGKEELMTLRGIGESRAEDIIAYRKKHGAFQKIEEIMKVSGIKDAAFEKIKEDITV